MMHRAKKSGLYDTSGAAIVEFTLTLPFLMLLAAGLSEFGLMLHHQQVLSKSVRDAARYAARAYVATASCPINVQPEWGQIVTDTKNIALRGSINASSPLLISNFNNASMVTVADGCAGATGYISPAGAGNNIPFITVTAVAPHTGTGFLDFLGLSNVNITAAHSEMWAGL